MTFGRFLTGALAFAVAATSLATAHAAVDYRAIAAKNQGSLTSPVLRSDITAKIAQAFADAHCSKPAVRKMTVAYWHNPSRSWLEQWTIGGCASDQRWTILFTPASDGGADYVIEPPAQGRAFDWRAAAAKNGGTVADRGTAAAILSKIQAASQQFDQCDGTVKARNVVFFQQLTTTWIEQWTVATCKTTRVFSVFLRLRPDGLGYDVQAERESPGGPTSAP